MSDEKIVLMARLKVKDDAVDEAKRLALGLVADSRGEEGCINYDIHQAIDDQTVFVWHETWKNKAALDEHFEKPYFKDFFARASDLAAEPPQINLTKMISEK
jgi:quinol monooxygenase YgiN